MEPSFNAMPGGLPICAVVSVWPKKSRMVRPHASRTCSMISGFSGSPAPATSRKDVRRDFMSSCTNIRQTVGGAQSVVTPFVAIASSMPRALKRG